MDKSGVFSDDRRLIIANDLAEIIEELQYLHILACDECAVTKNDINKIIDKLNSIELID